MEQGRTPVPGQRTGEAVAKVQAGPSRVPAYLQPVLTVGRDGLRSLHDLTNDARLVFAAVGNAHKAAVAGGNGGCANHRSEGGCIHHRDLYRHRDGCEYCRIPDALERHPVARDKAVRRIGVDGGRSGCRELFCLDDLCNRA